MKRILYFSMLLAGSFFHQATAQTPSRYLVKFKNKANNSFTLSTPAAYLSQRSIDRRTRYNIALDSTDLPVTTQYIDSLKSIPTVVVLNASKWLNQVSIQITDVSATNVTAVQNKINSFSFVKSFSAIALRTTTGGMLPSGRKLEEGNGNLITSRMNNIEGNYFNYGSSFNQVHIHNGEFLHNIGLHGEGMIIGMLDAGYRNYLTVNSLDSIRTNGQVFGTWDFVARKASVNEEHPHGMECLSTMAANLPGQFVGTAPKASFYLFRTEDAATEYPIEEHNWVCGAERIDSAGGDVISSSLGYNTFDAPLQNLSHTYAELNGHTTIAAMGANLAAKKGVLVVNAAGNEGNSSWGKIITPADGDSVMAVGAVNAAGVPASFSSRGPSADGRVKPDVASVGVGTVIQYPNNTIGGGNGTSFACPNMAGLTTSLWQGFQEFNNMKIIDALRKAGSRASNPNDTIGYGIPDVKKVLLNLTKDFSTATATLFNNKVTLNWTSKDVAAMKYEIERKAPGETGFTKISERFGRGNLFSTHSYTITDSLNTTGGTIVYRILQIIDTAAASFMSGYIDTVYINKANAADNSLLILPNPARNFFNLQITTSNAIQDLQVVITDAIGRMVKKSSHAKGPGTAIIPITIVNLARGKYFVTVFEGEKRIGTKILLKL